ncbi:MAG: response regulator [Rhodospirillaceae bacterium]|jgi:CheY-like chemotaxis protein|nr:response regulator [Rhodospirillaceae bacterium]MBT5561410.1 response regulator [Rhodospirillaceae bacterium]MBT6243233.1 response regulator [Rhodospirillaceae bacterium]
MQETPFKHQVLIVDDDTINIKLIGNVLREKFKILFATNGFDALKIAKANQPSLILLDVIMPEMNGFEVCEKLKSDPETHRIPIIFVTAENLPKDRFQGLGLGAIDYITKPFNPEDLSIKVFKYLAHD